MAIELLKALQVKQARDGELSDGGGLLLRVRERHREISHAEQ